MDRVTKQQVHIEEEEMLMLSYLFDNENAFHDYLQGNGGRSTDNAFSRIGMEKAERELSRAAKLQIRELTRNSKLFPTVLCLNSTHKRVFSKESLAISLEAIQEATNDL